MQGRFEPTRNPRQPELKERANRLRHAATRILSKSAVKQRRAEQALPLLIYDVHVAMYVVTHAHTVLVCTWFCSRSKKFLDSSLVNKNRRNEARMLPKYNKNATK
jgi:hypothetical protein